MEEAFSDPGSERRAAKTELAQRRQEKGESILMYEQVFSRLAVKAKMSEEEKVEKWLDNIHPVRAPVSQMRRPKPQGEAL
jgi:hypothetical protein